MAIRTFDKVYLGGRSVMAIQPFYKVYISSRRFYEVISFSWEICKKGSEPGA